MAGHLVGRVLSPRAKISPRPRTAAPRPDPRRRYACFAARAITPHHRTTSVRESGLSVGAIYSYFPSKEDLFLALSNDRAEQDPGLMNRALPSAWAHSADKSRESVRLLFRLLSDDLIPLARVTVEFLSEGRLNRRSASKSASSVAAPAFGHSFTCCYPTHSTCEVRADVDYPRRG